MSKPIPGRSALEASLSIDRLCDEFEQAWRQFRNPKIEEFLDRVDAPLRSRLLGQLLTLEFDLLKSRPEFSAYAKRFPEYRTDLTRVFEELDLMDWRGSQFGHFQIEREIARGGMGVVYLAHDQRLDRQVALKLLSRERRADSKWLRRFRREARLASSLNHPNLLTIFEIGEDRNTPYIACEYVDGHTLRESLAGRSIPLAQLVDYAIQIAGGMLAAHQAGIIHRDLKTDNVMVRRDGLLKILDFGLAKECENPELLLSRSGSITGTVHFMSPEQARGRELTTATDVFSFGVVLFLAATGQLPFQGQSTTDVLASILNDQPEVSSSHELDARFQLLIFRCLDKAPERRPGFSEILDDLRQFEDGSRRHPGSAAIEVPPTGENPGPMTSTGVTAPSPTRLEQEPSGIRYAHSGDVNIAWQEIGSGPIDIVFVMGWVSHLDWFWKDPSFAQFLQRLATFARVILFDKRGTGLSDRVPVDELPDLETRMDDVRAVMEAAGSQKAVLCGVSEGGPLCALFAATYPQKTLALTMLGSYSRRLWAEDYPWGPTDDVRSKFLSDIAANWGGPLGIEERAPSMAKDKLFRDWWASYLRMGASPGAAVALTKMNAQIDIRPILPSIHVPTLVLHRSGDRCLRVEEGRYLAEKIPGAKFVELPGEDHLPFVGNSEQVLTEIEIFLTGLTGGSHADYVLATVLHVKFTAGSQSADVPPPSPAEQFRKMVEREVTLFRGNNVFFDSSGLRATFDGPVRSILCARAISRLAERLQIAVRCGLDTGTCHIDHSGIYGPAVDSAGRIASLAPDSNVWISGTLRHLIAGTELQFEQLEQSYENSDLFQLVEST